MSIQTKHLTEILNQLTETLIYFLIVIVIWNENLLIQIVILQPMIWSQTGIYVHPGPPGL